MSSGRGFLVGLANVVGQLLRALLLNRGDGAGGRPGTSTAKPTSTTKRPSQSKRSSTSTTRPTGSTGRPTTTGAGTQRPGPVGARKPPASAHPEARSDSALSAARAVELAARERLLDGEPSPGQLGATATFEVDHAAVGSVVVTYAPQQDGAPDAGEVVWTWIPYEEADGRGKDRPVLIIGRRDADHVYAVRLTSKSHDGERDFIAIGSGAWDGQGRPSWVDVDQLYEVHERGLRREAAVLDKRRFSAVADVLHQRYGWKVAA